MFPLHQLVGSNASNVYELVISANAYNVNLKTEIEALYGAVSGVVVVNCTVLSGVKIGSTSTATPAFHTGGFAALSTIKLTNHGRIAGKGGAGSGTGSGAPGGPAMKLDDNLTIDNTDGEIFGGGGGGGRGASVDSIPSEGVFICGGGGGGGGQGIDGGAGGAGAVLVDPFGSSGADGNDGNEAGPGTGGGAGCGAGGKGGTGGGWGSAGIRGGKSGNSGGAGGKAIDLNGKTVTWLAGNDTTHVKGAVS